MTPMRWRQIQSVFEAALKLRPKDRVAYIRQARASDDYVAAERHFLRAVMLSEKLVSSSKQPLQRSLQGYADLLHVTGRDEEAQKVRARIAALANE